MARKSKSRKYKPRNEFRYTKNKITTRHPHYLFGETKNGKYKSLGLTTSPIDYDNLTAEERAKLPKRKQRYIALSKNPNLNDTETSYIKWDVYTMPPECYEDKVLQNWKFDKKDMPIVRHRMREYKKSCNRQPKNWYIKKRKWNKKNR